jgi:carboxyl-terminal processing protease
MRKLILFILLLSFTAVNAQKYSADTLRQKCITMCRFLEQQHYKPIQWNDTTSVILYDHWIKILDKDKLLFTQQDMAQLISYRTKLGEEFKGNSWGFFDKSLTIYRRRIKYTDSAIAAILSKPLDYSKPDNLSWPLTDYAASTPALYQQWQRFLKWQILRDIAESSLDTGIASNTYAKLPANFAALELKSREKIKKRLLSSVKESIENNFESDLGDLYLGAVSWCYDPHTQYMNVGEKKHFENIVNSQEFSAGIQIIKNDKGDWEITYLIPGGAAWANGELHKGDVILKVKLGNNAEKELASIDNDKEVQELLKGNEFENIVVTIRTAGGIQKVVPLQMQKITNEGGIVKGYVLKGNEKVGYIKLPGFYTKEGDEDNGNSCSNDVAKEVIKLKKDSISGLILDLRYNGGGSIWEALELAGIFINEGPITSLKDKEGKVHFLKDPNRGTIYDGPMLILINGSSASASELVSAALQDYHRALIVGSTTYGKGSAQVVLPMDTTGNFSEKSSTTDYVKVTDEKFYRIDGSTTQWKGVVPDIFLPQIEYADEYNEKSNASALQPDFSKPAFYDALPVLPIAGLKEKSEIRVAENNYFNAISDFSTWYKNDKKGFVIPLQWPAYSALHKVSVEKYKEIENRDDSTKTLLTAINSRFDKDRIAMGSAADKKMNDVKLTKIENDNYIVEAYLIMTDWLTMKK